MTRQTLFILCFLAFLFGCDFGRPVKERVDNGVIEGKEEMETDISLAKLVRGIGNYESKKSQNPCFIKNSNKKAYTLI